MSDSPPQTVTGLNFAPSDEQRLIVETVRAFVERELYPHEDTVERLRHVPADIAADIRQKAIAQGLFAPNFPTGMGGGGLDPVTMALMDRELGRANMALQYCVARPSTILRAATGTQIEDFLLPTVRGARIDCIAMTEPEAGSDLRAMRTRAEREGDDYVITGTKHFISKADIADFIILFAATGFEDTPRGRRARVSCFLVDKDTPGVAVRAGYRSLSHNGYNNCIVEFDAARVPARNRLGEEHQGLALADTWLGSTRLQVAAMCLGRGHRALELSRDWAATRVQFGKPIIENQAIAHMLADMATDLTAAELVTLQAAFRTAEGSASPADPAMAKLLATEMLARVADKAVQIHGGMGVMEELPIARIWRDARVERIWDGTSEIQRHIIAREMMKSAGITRGTA
jgi:alkylation response protein AidB-like acyl-CoA dehydrogenase